MEQKDLQPKTVFGKPICLKSKKKKKNTIRK